METTTGRLDPETYRVAEKYTASYFMGEVHGFIRGCDREGWTVEQAELAYGGLGYVYLNVEERAADFAAGYLRHATDALVRVQVRDLEGASLRSRLT